MRTINDNKFEIEVENLMDWIKHVTRKLRILTSIFLMGLREIGEDERYQE